MKKSFFIFLIALSFNFLCCGSEKTEKHKTVASINDFDLTLDEFQYQFASEMEFNQDYKLTKEVKKNFLEGMIRKEVLIQEAKKLKLDREKKFIRTIERYWESTLIRDLMETKGNEICKRIVISQDEIDARYKDLKGSKDKFPPLSELREKIVYDLKAQKRMKLLMEWIDDLRKKSNVQINEELLYKD